MKVYTKNEIRKIIHHAYDRGFDDGRNRRGTDKDYPAVSEIVFHPMTGSLVVATKESSASRQRKVGKLVSAVADAFRASDR